MARQRGRLAGQRRQFKYHMKSTAQAVTQALNSKCLLNCTPGHWRYPLCLPRSPREGGTCPHLHFGSDLLELDNPEARGHSSSLSSDPFQLLDLPGENVHLWRNGSNQGLHRDPAGCREIFFGKYSSISELFFGSRKLGWLGHEASSKSKHTKSLPTTR